MTTSVLRVEVVFSEPVADVQEALSRLSALSPPPRLTEAGSNADTMAQQFSLYGDQLKGFGIADLTSVSAMAPFHGYQAQVTLDDQSYADGDTISFGTAVYTLELVPADAFSVQIGPNENVTTQNLVDTINATLPNILWAALLQPNEVRVVYRGLDPIAGLTPTDTSNPLGAAQKYDRFVLGEIGSVLVAASPTFILSGNITTMFDNMWVPLIGQGVDCFDGSNRNIKRNTVGPLFVKDIERNANTVYLSGDAADLAAIQPGDEFAPIVSTRQLNTFHSYGGR